MKKCPECGGTNKTGHQRLCRSQFKVRVFIYTFKCEGPSRHSRWTWKNVIAMNLTEAREAMQKSFGRRKFYLEERVLYKVPSLIEKILQEERK